MAGARMRTVTPSFGCPDQRRGGKHAVERVDKCAVREKHAHGFHAAGHRSLVQRRDPFVVLRICVETAREHGFEDGSVSALGWHLQHEMMLGTKLATEIRVGLEHRAGARAVAACTGRYKTV